MGTRPTGTHPWVTAPYYCTSEQKVGFSFNKRSDSIPLFVYYLRHCLPLGSNMTVLSGSDKFL